MMTQNNTILCLLAVTVVLAGCASPKDVSPTYCEVGRGRGLEKVAFAFGPLAFYQSHTGGLIQTVKDERVVGFLKPFVLIVPKTDGLYRWSLGGVNFERIDNPDGTYRILGRSDQLDNPVVRSDVVVRGRTIVSFGVGSGATPFRHCGGPALEVSDLR